MTTPTTVRQSNMTPEAPVSKCLNGNAYYVKLRRRKCDTDVRRALQCPVSTHGMIAALRALREAPRSGRDGDIIPRRIAFASIEGASRQTTDSLGGWAPGSDIANRVYRDKANRVGRREARTARAALRGEEKTA